MDDPQSDQTFDAWLEDAMWFSPCPPGFEIDPWRKACEEIVLLCVDPIVRLLKRVVPHRREETQ